MSFKCGNCNKHVNTRYPVVKEKEREKKIKQNPLCVNIEIRFM